MKIGISVASAYRVDDPRDGARFMIERTRAARLAGFDSLFVGDHHATPQPYYQNVPMLARMLAEWGDATAGALFHHPAVAEIARWDRQGTGRRPAARQG